MSQICSCLPVESVQYVRFMVSRKHTNLLEANISTVLCGTPHQQVAGFWQYLTCHRGYTTNTWGFLAYRSYNPPDDDWLFLAPYLSWCWRNRWFGTLRHSHYMMVPVLALWTSASYDTLLVSFTCCRGNTNLSSANLHEDNFWQLKLSLRKSNRLSRLLALRALYRYVILTMVLIVEYIVLCSLYRLRWVKNYYPQE